MTASQDQPQGARESADSQLGSTPGKLERASGEAAPAGDARVFAVIGDRYHNADFIRVHLDRLFGEMGLGYDYTIDTREITSERLSRYPVFLFFRDGYHFAGGYIGPDAFPYAAQLMNDPPNSQPKSWITEEAAAAIKGYVEAGGGLYAMHNNPNVANFSETYRSVVKGIYQGHPAVRPFKVEVVRGDHPITEGVTDWITTDEEHYPEFDGDPATVLLRSVNIDGLVFEDKGTTNTSGWAHEVGQGRVVHSAMGHNLYALWQPSYLTFQKNAIRWLLREI
ncbi:MAG: ThuA domain-containing protein [Candidatus Dormiibacterota bacterium]